MATEQLPRAATQAPEDEATWYKDAVIYQAHVRAFCDSDADGVGDFTGLTRKLGYLQELGVTAVWLLPFYPSPLRDDGYDISNYTNVHPSYGTLRDFQAFLKEAHRRGLKVITELVLNHTSDEHPWFHRARRAPPNSPARSFYVWSDSPDRYRSARIIFKDFESSNWAWDPVARSYYWHRFYSHQPDLNLDNPTVHKELFQAVDFWLRQGVDGLRLDAVPYLYEREGTSCENLPETHAFIRRLRAHVDEHFPNRMLLAEANQWPEDAAAYFGNGDECHMNFHFPLMPRLFMSLRMEDRFPIVDILSQTPQIPENAQWAIFLRNHDELTLEMVTDEDRDYMYRAYAQDAQARINLGIRRRLAPLLGNNRRRIELLNGLLLSLPGTPIIYYGDEIGMGDNIHLGDRNSVRTPMQWSGDRNAGFSQANPQKLYLPVNTDPEYHYETVNVEVQHNNPHSLYWWMRRVISLRKRYRAFGRGSIEFLHPENRKVLAFIRRYGDEVMLVVANLSRFTQFAELDLEDYARATPVELFGRTEFPRISAQPYFITLGPHAFHWFELRREQGGAQDSLRDGSHLTLTVAGSWEELLTGHLRPIFESMLPDYLRRQRWFGAKARTIQSCQIKDVVPVKANNAPDARILLVKVDYVEGEPETYVLPVSFTPAEESGQVLSSEPDSIIAIVNAGISTSGVIHEITADPAFLRALLEAVARRRVFRGGQGRIEATPAPAFRALRRSPGRLDPWVIRAEQTNTSIAYGKRLILKLVRRPDPGINPDLEVTRFLGETAYHVNSPRLAGSLEYLAAGSEPMTVGILREYVENEGDAWGYTLDALAAYYEHILSRPAADRAQAILPETHLLDIARQTAPGLAGDTIGDFLQSAELLGRRTGELHVALASVTDAPAFMPEPFTPFYQRSVFERMRRLAAQVTPLLQRALGTLSPGAQALAAEVLSRNDEIIARFRSVLDQPLSGTRVRVHGDYHLGQILFTGKDFVIIDFEGEPARPMGERRLKRSPMKDVAGMLRSFQYAAYIALHNLVSVGMIPQEQVEGLEAWARFWYVWVSAAFLRGYLEVATTPGILPETDAERAALLDACLMEKAIYEVGYELNNRPEWVHIPLTGILELIRSRA